MQNLGKGVHSFIGPVSNLFQLFVFLVRGIEGSCIEMAKFQESLKHFSKKILQDLNSFQPREIYLQALSGQNLCVRWPIYVLYTLLLLSCILIQSRVRVSVSFNSKYHRKGHTHTHTHTHTHAQHSIEHRVYYLLFNARTYFMFFVNFYFSPSNILLFKTTDMKKVNQHKLCYGNIHFQVKVTNVDHGLEPVQKVRLLLVL